MWCHRGKTVKNRWKSVHYPVKIICELMVLRRFGAILTRFSRVKIIWTTVGREAIVKWSKPKIQVSHHKSP